MEPTLHTSGLGKNYGDFAALADLNLSVSAGEVFGFLGPNGAGKTTAIRLLMNEIRATSGTASILGMDVHRDSLALRHRIGYLPSELALYPNMTGADLIHFFANLRGGVDGRYVEQLAERLNAQMAKKIGDLSSGNRQKIGIIQAFMNKPEFVILDEPSAGLDPLVHENTGLDPGNSRCGWGRFSFEPHFKRGAAGCRPGGNYSQREADRTGDNCEFAWEKYPQNRA